MNESGAATTERSPDAAFSDLAPISMLPQIVRLIDDATLDRVECVYGEQRDFLLICAQQFTHWREGRLTAAQEREIGRLEQALAVLLLFADGRPLSV